MMSITLIIIMSEPIRTKTRTMTRTRTNDWTRTKTILKGPRKDFSKNLNHMKRASIQLENAYMIAKRQL